MTNPKDVFLKMLSDEPGLYDVLKSKEHTLVLNILEKDNFDFNAIKAYLSQQAYINKDIILYNILDTLIKKDLIKKININNKEIYFLTDKGKNFIKVYNQTRQEFSLI